MNRLDALSRLVALHILAASVC